MCSYDFTHHDIRDSADLNKVLSVSLAKLQLVCPVQTVITTRKAVTSFSFACSHVGPISVFDNMGGRYVLTICFYVLFICDVSFLSLE